MQKEINDNRKAKITPGKYKRRKKGREEERKNERKRGRRGERKNRKSEEV